MHNSSCTDEDLIVALASGLAPSAIAIIRVSGKGCHNLLINHLKPKTNAKDFRKLSLYDFIDLKDGVVIDSLLVAFFKQTSSFTGEEYAEIHCHGGRYIISKILDNLYNSGFREALPGEFTKRAFLNHRIDLTSAEGINELINADSHQQWMAAKELVEGKLKNTIDQIRNDLIHVLAHLNARLDFPEEEDVGSSSVVSIKNKVREIKSLLSQLAATYDDGRIASEGFLVGIFGPPNTGKSTLMNKLLGIDRVIVTPHAGTTRDYVEEKCLIEGRLFRLVDMAGIRQPLDEIEKIGIEKSWKLAEKSDLLLILTGSDLSLETWTKFKENLSKLQNKTKQMVLTKSDLPEPLWFQTDSKTWLKISCKNDVGISNLKRLLVEKIDSHLEKISDRRFITCERHLRAIKSAEDALDKFFVAEENGHYEECLAFELQQAVKSLSSIIGEVHSELILDEIFKRFCIGK